MGREFIELFEEWADSYDASVEGHDVEYEAVFKYYENILTEVAKRAEGHVVEFGPGTGNLTKKLVDRQLQVTAIEPSQAMRLKAIQKLNEQARIIDGDFLNFQVEMPINTIVSTYAFHHLTDKEKAQAICYYGNLLASNGKIVFADTMFETSETYVQTIESAKTKGFHNLAADLEREYYTTIPILKEMLEKNGFSTSFHRCNDFVWILEAQKQ